MIIAKVLIDEDIKRKILEKHGVYLEEIENGLLSGKPLFYKAKENKYIAFTFHHRFITIIFTYNHSSASIVTAYPSAQWQKNLYKKKMVKS